MSTSPALAGPETRPMDYRVTYDAGLVEEAVLRAERGLAPAERAVFHRERDPLYEVRDEDEREARFEELHGRWFSRLGLDRPLHEALAEEPALLMRSRDCRVLRVTSLKEEMADVVAEIGREDAASIVVRLRPESLLEPEGLRGRLHHELGHVADILDPTFGYRRELPPSDGGPPYDNLLRDRYRAVWDATIDGRLLRRGLACAGVRDERLAEFAQAFPRLGVRTEEAFVAWFDRPHPTHAEIVAFILDPVGEGSPSGTCPICRLPTCSLEPHPEHLGEGALGELTRDHPAWRPDRGICPQCADLYRARHLAASA